MIGKYNFMNSVVVSLFLIFMLAVSQPATAQEVTLSDTTIATEVTFTSNDVISVGPRLTITGTGVASLRARNKIVFFTDVHVLNGGQLHTETGLAVDIETEEKPALPEKFVVFPNYPNPFNPSTTVRYRLPVTKYVKADVFTIYGERVANLLSGRVQAGEHSLVWDGKNQAGQRISSGIYYLHIAAGGYHSVVKMVLLK